VLTEPLLRRGFLSSPTEIDASRPVVGPRLGREVSSPDVFQPSDECLVSMVTAMDE
jgi:hypothetical protein